MSKHEKSLYAIECRKITKTFGQVLANDKIDLNVKYGEILALLGENGSGKTTLMRMICGILKPESGTISFDGIDVSEENYRSMLGYLPQDFGYYPEFSGIAQSTKTSRFR